MSQRHFLIALLVPRLDRARDCSAMIRGNPTRPYTFGVVYDMLRGGSWLVPTLAGEPFLDEPPLYYLTAAANCVVPRRCCRCTMAHGSPPGCIWR